MAAQDMTNSDPRDQDANAGAARRAPPPVTETAVRQGPWAGPQEPGWQSKPSEPGVGAEPADQIVAGKEADAPPEDPRPSYEALEQTIKHLHTELDERGERLLRMQAEMENVRKRLEREKVDHAKYAIGGFARDMIAVADNFQRAIEAVPAEQLEEGSPLVSLLEGIFMVEREFLNAMSRHTVVRSEPRGEPFDPNLHQAVSEVADPSVPSGTIVQVFQAGYSIADRVLRPAVVVVAKGGPKAAKSPAADDVRSEPSDIDERDRSA